MSAPDAVGIGEPVRCPCGRVQLAVTAGHPALSLSTRCDACGATIEAVPSVSPVQGRTEASDE